MAVGELPVVPTEGVARWSADDALTQVGDNLMRVGGRKLDPGGRCLDFRSNGPVVDEDHYAPLSTDRFAAREAHQGYRGQKGLPVSDLVLSCSADLGNSRVQRYGCLFAPAHQAAITV